MHALMDFLASLKQMGLKKGMESRVAGFEGTLGNLRGKAGFGSWGCKGGTGICRLIRDIHKGE